MINSKYIIKLSVLALLLIYTNFYIFNDKPEKLFIYIWADYLSPSIIEEFEEETGIQVVYDVFDSEEILDTKLTLRHSGYDLVLSSNGHLLYNQIASGLYLPLDRSKIADYHSINQSILGVLRKEDLYNQYVIPWMWGVTGIGYNHQQLRNIIPLDQINSLNTIFNPEILSKISEHCNIEWFSSPSEMFGLALIYAGISPSPITEEKLEIAKGILEKARPYIYKISNASYNLDLVKGESCISVGWIGDIAQTVLETNNKALDFKIFKQGNFISVDVLAILKESKNVENAYKFINFLLRKENIAKNSNFTKHINANINSYALIDKKIVENKNINPSNAILEQSYSSEKKSTILTRLQNRIWIYILSEVNKS